MKKTLHGKRYLRSRASVQIGRDRKRIKKFNRDMEILRAAIFNLMSGDWLKPLIDAFINLGWIMNDTVIKSMIEVGDVLGAQKAILERMDNEGSRH